MPLEADEVVDRTGRAAMAAQLMLSGGEKGGLGADRFASLEGDAVCLFGQAAYRTAPPDFGALAAAAFSKASSITSRDRLNAGNGKAAVAVRSPWIRRTWWIGSAPSRAGSSRVMCEIGRGLDADELAADFVAGAGFAFKQDGAAARLRQQTSGGGSRWPPPMMAASHII